MWDAYALLPFLGLHLQEKGPCYLVNQLVLGVQAIPSSDSPGLVTTLFVRIEVPQLEETLRLKIWLRLCLQPTSPLGDYRGYIIIYIILVAIFGYLG